MAEVKEAKAIAKFVRIAPRKVRIVMDLIRGKDVADAFAILKFTPKRGATLIQKVLKSAVANAENNFDMACPVMTTVAVPAFLLFLYDSV